MFLDLPCIPIYRAFFHSPKSTVNQKMTVLRFQKYHVHYHLSLVPKCHCALVAAAVFAAAFSCHITSFENAEAVTCSLPRQNTNNFNCFWVKYHLFSVHIGNCEEHK